MTRVWPIFRAGSVCGAWLFLAVGAFAAEQGEAAGGAGNPHTNDVFRWINFAILAAFFIWLFWKKLGPWFRKNAEKISAAISSSAQVKAEAERKLREAESKLANLQNETAKLRAESQRESAAEAQRIRAATRSDQQRVAAAAKAEIEAAERAARVELKALAAQLAVENAESLLVKQLTPAAQEALIRSFVENLGGRPN
jgi:F-type H+-transporting ATPase subunit b